MRSLKPLNYVKGPKTTCLAALLLLGVTLTAGCSRDASGNKESAERPAIPVTVSDVVKKDMPVQLRAVGTVEAYSTVSVQAQVTGELTYVHFEDGQCLKAGDPLFTIDPRPFEVQLKQMKANLAKNKAQLENARKQVVRNSSMVDKGYVSKEAYDQVTANAAALAAAVKAEEAAVENAELQLKYCFISSPMDGCAGEVKVHRGNLVKANDVENPLVIIKQISPIYVNFHIPERNLPDVKRYMAEVGLKVQATIPSHENHSVRGELTFLDNTVNPTTGTIELKATFPNQDRSLWPGQFVNVVLTLATQAGAVVVPSQAVQTGQDGQYAFVVNPDLTVDYRIVDVERISENEAVIAGGIRPGEKVVTDGHLRLSQNALVKIVEEGEAKGEAVQ